MVTLSRHLMGSLEYVLQEAHTTLGPRLDTTYPNQLATDVLYTWVEIGRGSYKLLERKRIFKQKLVGT